MSSGNDKIYDIALDGIGLFNNFFPKELCDDMIEYFNLCDRNGYTKNRQISNGYRNIDVSDKQLFLEDLKFLPESETVCPYSYGKHFLDIFWNECYPLYTDKFFHLKHIDMHKIYNMKLQKTSPSEGYHIWHSEVADRQTCNRILTFILYLNDIEEGGETEFLYQKKRILPKAGRLALWSGSYLHTHRGNPPLSGDKYVLTGWVEL